MVRRPSEFRCPRCDTLLVERWDVAQDSTGEASGGMVQIGRPYCPRGHYISAWTADGAPLQAA